MQYQNRRHSSKLPLQCSRRILYNETVILIPSNSKVIHTHVNSTIALKIFLLGIGRDREFRLDVCSIYRPYWVSVFPDARYGGLVDDHGFCPRLKTAHIGYSWVSTLSAFHLESFSHLYPF